MISKAFTFARSHTVAFVGFAAVLASGCSSKSASGPSTNPDGGVSNGVHHVDDGAGGAGSDGMTSAAGSGGAIDEGGASNGGPDASSRTDHDGGRTSADGGLVPEPPILGAYCGNVVADVQAFESWLGRPVGGILGYTGAASWTDFDGSVGWATGLWSAIDRRVLWSVPLIPTGATLESAAAGDYDDHYLKAAKTLAAFRPGDAKLYVRTGWEFNGNWFPWTAQGKAAAYAGAFQRFVTVFRSVSNRFVFEWNVNLGDSGMNPADAYPGDGYVDLIGMDFYWKTEYDPADPQKAWDQKVSESYGLAWHQDFAKAHGKPTTYSEWGIESDNADYYIQHAQAWFQDHHVVYETYWNSNADFPGKLSDGQYPHAGAAYKTAFGP